MTFSMDTTQLYSHRADRIDRLATFAEAFAAGPRDQRVGHQMMLVVQEELDLIEKQVRRQATGNRRSDVFQDLPKEQQSKLGQIRHWLRVLVALYGPTEEQA